MAKMNLLDLPPEIRHSIWILLVVSYDTEIKLPKQISKTKKGSRGWNNDGFVSILLQKQYEAFTSNSFRYSSIWLRQSSRPSLAIAFTCRQIYLEATKLYYSLNTFYRFIETFGNPFRNFFNSIGPSNTKNIRSISLYLSPPFEEEDDGLILRPSFKLKTLPLSLENVQINFGQPFSTDFLRELEARAKRGQWKLELCYRHRCRRQYSHFCHHCALFRKDLRATIAAVNRKKWAKGDKKAKFTH